MHEIEYKQLLDGFRDHQHARCERDFDMLFKRP